MPPDPMSLDCPPDDAAPRDLDPTRDPWLTLRPATPARIGLHRAGDAVALRHVLELQLGHARARDAVHLPINVDRVCEDLAPREAIRVHSGAPDRETYLRRPDFGRALDPESAGALPKGPFDAVFVIADGLSSLAAESHGAAMAAATIARLDGWVVAPIVVATQARVALADAIGERMEAAFSIILIGERPGLSSADSLGAYLTREPHRGRRDSERNCISNIRPGGLSIDHAADKLAWLMREARRRGVTGVALKDESPMSTTRLPPA